MINFKVSLLLHQVNSFVLGLKKHHVSVKEILEQSEETRLLQCEAWFSLGGYLFFMSSGHSFKSPQRIMYESWYLLFSSFNLEVTSLNKILLEAWELKLYILHMVKIALSC